jgi:hypothetical protein
MDLGFEGFNTNFPLRISCQFSFARGSKLDYIPALIGLYWISLPTASFPLGASRIQQWHRCHSVHYNFGSTSPSRRVVSRCHSSSANTSRNYSTDRTSLFAQTGASSYTCGVGRIYGKAATWLSQSTKVKLPQTRCFWNTQHHFRACSAHKNNEKYLRKHRSFDI